MTFDFESSLFAVGLDSDPNRFVQHSIHNGADTTRSRESIGFCKFQNGFPQSVVIGNDFDEIETFMKPLYSMDFRRPTDRHRE